MLSFLVKRPPRTRVSGLNRITFDDGRSSVEFCAPGDRYFLINRLPPAPTSLVTELGPHPANCVINPPIHWHSKQMEIFHVLKGEAKFYLGGQERIASAGEIVEIPVAAHHTFRNASTENNLVIEFKLDPTTPHKDEAFFSAFGYYEVEEDSPTGCSGNAWAYRDDCRMHGTLPNFYQVAMFNRRGNVCRALQGPRFVVQPLSLCINFLGSMIGRFLLGFSYSYDE